MNVKEFNKIKKEVKAGNLKVLKEDIVKSFTLKQAKEIDDEVFNHEIPDYLNPILDILVSKIQAEETESKKVANNKNLKAPNKNNKKEEKKEEKKEGKEVNILNKIKVGDIVKFRVEGEEMEHHVKIIYISKYDVIAITENEKEVFKIRKTDFKKQIFNWTDRHGEAYNIIVSL